MNCSALNRRQLLQLLGIGAGSSAVALVSPLRVAGSSTAGKAALPFKPVRAPLPLPNDGLSAADQRRLYRTFSVDDKLLVPEGYRAELIAVWGIVSPRVASGSTTTTWRSRPCLVRRPC
jgi:secreted PhoX family phosphatase